MSPIISPSGGGGGGSQPLPLSTCYLECNNAPIDGGSAIWDTIYDRRGFPHTLAAIPAEMGLTLTGGAGTVSVVEAGLWHLELMSNPTADATAIGHITLHVNGDYSGGPTIDMPDLTGATGTLESCLVSMADLIVGDTINVDAFSSGATAPGYKMLSYAVLKLIRLG